MRHKFLFHLVNKWMGDFSIDVQVRIFRVVLGDVVFLCVNDVLVFVSFEQV